MRDVSAGERGALAKHGRQSEQETDAHVDHHAQPRLVAISKLHSPSAILAAHSHAKQLHFGENYAQELEAKAKVLPATIKWHFVGKLQSNKAKMVAGIPNLYLVETLDSAKCATALEKALSGDAGGAREEPLGVYLQINTSGEEAKGGMEPLQGEPSGEEEVVRVARHVMHDCPSLRLRGLMTIGAASNSQISRDSEGAAEASREQVGEEARQLNPDFARLYETRRLLLPLLQDNDDKAVRERYGDMFPGTGTDGTGGLELSMGMSSDLEMAIRAGSDNVRVGTDCFGARPPSRDEAMDAMKDELAARV